MNISVCLGPLGRIPPPEPPPPPPNGGSHGGIGIMGTIGLGTGRSVISGLGGVGFGCSVVIGRGLPTNNGWTVGIGVGFGVDDCLVSVVGNTGG